MKRGKTKKEKNYLSIMLVPHFTGKVKILKFTSFYSRLLTILAIVLFLLIGTGFFVVYIIDKNAELEKRVSQLTEITVDQSKLIKEKDSEIDIHKQNENTFNSKIKDYADKYKEITDNYITNHSDNAKTNRSGDRTDRAFIDDIKELKDRLDAISDSEISENEASSALKDTEKKLKNYADSIPTLWPATGKITSPFGGRKDPFQYTSKFHEGLDIAAGYGQKIEAAGSGQVIFAGWYGGYGNAIIIDHGNGITTVYGHCSKLIAKKNQAVKKGDEIARVGSTGRSTGSHLHFEVRLNETPVDPLKYLNNN